MREATGEDFIVGIRIAGEEFDPDGLDLEVTLDTCRRLDRSGLVDYVNVCVGRHPRAGRGEQHRTPDVRGHRAGPPLGRSGAQGGVGAGVRRRAHQSAPRGGTRPCRGAGRHDWHGARPDRGPGVRAQGRAGPSRRLRPASPATRPASDIAARDSASHASSIPRPAASSSTHACGARSRGSTLR